MGYLTATLLSVLFAFLGFVTETTNGNIGHLENGREPNAGAAIFPVIPFGPLCLVGLVWLLNRAYENLGFWSFAVFAGWFIPSWWVNQRRLNKRLKALELEKNRDA